MEFLNLIIKPIQSAKNGSLDKISMKFCNVIFIIIIILTTIFMRTVFISLGARIIIFLIQLVLSYFSLLLGSILLFALIRIIAKNKISYGKSIRILFPYFLIHSFIMFGIINMPRYFGVYYILNFRLYLRIALCLWISVQLYIQMKYYLKYENSKNLIISIIWGLPFLLTQLFFMPN